MWIPIARETAVVATNAAETVPTPAAVGDKQPVYLVISAPTAAFSLTKDADTAASAFVVGIGETWVAGPILGQDLDQWGLFAAAPVADGDILYISARLNVDPRAAALSVHESPAKTPLLDFTWKQLV